LLVSVNHLQKAREVLSRKRKKRGGVDSSTYDTNGHSPNGHITLKSNEIIRTNSITPPPDPDIAETSVSTPPVEDAVGNRIKVKKKKKAPPKEYEPPEAMDNPFSPEELLAANDKLSHDWPNLIYKGEDIPRVETWVRNVQDMSLDVETYGIARKGPWRKKLALSLVRGRIRLVQLHSGGETYFLDAALLPKEFIARVLELLKGKPIYGHNLIFDLPRIKKHFGVDLMGEELRDTIVLSRLARAGDWKEDGRYGDKIYKYRHGLGDALRQEGVAKISKEVDHAWHEPLISGRLQYALDDVCYLKELHERLMELIAKRDMVTGLDLVLKAYPVYMRMQYRGVPFNKDLFEEYKQRLEALRGDALKRLEELAPPHPEGDVWRWLNRNSVKPEDPEGCTGSRGVKRCLEILGYDRGLANALGQKAEREEFLGLSSDPHPFVEALHDYYAFEDQLKSCREWLFYHYEDDRLHMEINFISKVTGRTDFNHPALQNIPKEKDERVGISLRECIRAPEGTRIVKADYGAQELRIIAYLSQDQDLIEAFKSEDQDPHVRVGELLAGHPLDKKKNPDEYKRFRGAAKNANYGLGYGAGIATYREATFRKTGKRVSKEDAETHRKVFRDTWKGVRAWQQKEGPRDGSCEEDWYMKSFYGRRRYVDPQWNDRIEDYVPKYTDRLNAPVQSGGVDMLFLALAMLQDDTAAEAGVEIIITTHDEIVLEVPESEVEVAEHWLYTQMREALRELIGEDLATEDCVEVLVGQSWAGD